MKTVLLTGNKGYIGSNLEMMLSKRKYEVIGIDRMSGYDINTHNTLNSLRKDPDIIVHLAAMASIVDCREDPKGCIMDNVLATEKVVALSKKMGCPVVFSSSGAADAPEASLYGTTKMINELQMKETEAVCLRFSNVYGGINYYADKTSVVAAFIQSIKAGKSLVINGDGSQTRDFIHVNDICRAIILAMESKEAIDQIIDVGTGKETSILDLAKMFDHPFIFNKESNSVGVMSAKAKIKKGNELLKFVAQEDLQTEIKKLIQK